MPRAASILGVVPARFASTRFPGKLLADLCGKPVVVRTVEAAQRATSLSKVWVATDDDRIGQAVASACPMAEVIHTDPECPSGSDRVVAALAAKGFVSAGDHGHGVTAKQGTLTDSVHHDVTYSPIPFDAIVNIQGDEPLLDPSHIDAAVEGLLENPGADISTLVHRLDTTSEKVGVA